MENVSCMTKLYTKLNTNSVLYSQNNYSLAVVTQCTCIYMYTLLQSCTLYDVHVCLLMTKHIKLDIHVLFMYTCTYSQT